MELQQIATIRSGFNEKFGIPRQSNLVDVKAEIIFEPEYRREDAIRGIEEYSHLWLIWGFSKVEKRQWSPVVRPPRLGGNKRVGVFATRSPYRPNPIGLSSVKLIGIKKSETEGIILQVSGADLLNGSPIYDIKPYLPYVDCHFEASGGFSEVKKEHKLQVQMPYFDENFISKDEVEIIRELLAQDPRPSYQNDPNRLYGMNYLEYNIRFRVIENKVYVEQIERI